MKSQEQNFINLKYNSIGAKLFRIMFEKNILPTEKYRELTKKSNLKLFDEPLFSAKDIAEVFPEITYRKLNDWDSKDLLTNHREDEKSWRKFTLRDFIALKLINDLKEYGLSNEKIKMALASLFELNEKKKLRMFEFFFTGCMEKNHRVVITVFHDGDACFITEVCQAFFQGLDLNLGKPFLVIPFYIYIQPFWGVLTKKLPQYEEETSILGRLKDDADLKYQMIIEFLKKDDFVEIVIQKKDDNLIIRPKRTGNNVSIEQLVQMVKEKNFQNIQLKIQNGAIVHLSQEEVGKIKF